MFLINDFYNFLLSFNISEPAINEKVDVIKNIKFIPEFHEFLKNNHKLEYIRKNDLIEPRSNNYINTWKDLLYATQFVTKYWDVFRHQKILLIWICDRDISNEVKIFESMFTLIDIKHLNPRDTKCNIKDLNINGGMFNIFLYWDSDVLLDDDFLRKINPLYLQITVNKKILEMYGNFFWDGRIYYCFNNDTYTTRLVTKNLWGKIKYDPKNYEKIVKYNMLKNIRMRDVKFLNIFTGQNIGYHALHVFNLENDWESTLMINIVKEYLEKTMIFDGDIVKVNENDVYSFLHKHFLVGKIKMIKSNM